MSLELEDKIFVAGHGGMVGSAIVRNFESKGFNNILTVKKEDLDLTNQDQVKNFFSKNTIDKVIIAAAKVGGIGANSQYPVDFLINNLYIQSNILSQAYENDVEQVLFLGSSCIYPKFTESPIKEDQLLSGKLEITNEWYALAKIAGIKLSEAFNIQFNTDFRSIMPTNLYGPYDNFNLENGHVIPALINKFHDAKRNNFKSVEVWGTGKPRREFLHVDDLAEACFFIMNLSKNDYMKSTDPSMSHINVGTGQEISINNLIDELISVTKFKGNIVYDETRPDGTMTKVLDVSKINALGWRHKIDLENGLKDTYEWYEKNYPKVRF